MISADDAGRAVRHYLAVCSQARTLGDGDVWVAAAVAVLACQAAYWSARYGRARALEMIGSDEERL